ncbi:MAG: Na(+)-translocating NADH-quinone reductase subunit C [Acidobacteriota bacterium]
MQRDSVIYTVIFSAILCVVCAILVSTAAVQLKDLQTANEALDEQRNVLQAAGLIAPGDKPTSEEVADFFAATDVVLVDMQEGKEVEVDGIDPATYNPLKAQNDPAMSYRAPQNKASVRRVAQYARVYKFKDDQGTIEKLVLPIEGYGLWGTLYGFLAIEADTETVAGITYYRHKETPGLGGEVDNPSWKALWPGRKLFDEQGVVALEVIKGAAGSVDSDPYSVDGLSGATITGRGVTNMLEFWMGPDGFGPYLENFRQQRSAA